MMMMISIYLRSSLVDNYKDQTPGLQTTTTKTTTERFFFVLLMTMLLLLVLTTSFVLSRKTDTLQACIYNQLEESYNFFFSEYT